MEQAVELLLHLANFLALLLLAFEGKVIALVSDLLLARLQGSPFVVDLAQLVVQTVEKARDVLGLRGQLLARFGNDLRVQPKLLGDVDAGRRSRNAHAQLVRRSQCAFLETNRRIEYALGVRCVNLKSRVMRRHDAHTSGTAKEVGYRDSQCGAFLRIGGRTQLVEQYQRIARRVMRDEIDVGDVRREGREV